jgi:hypothetical protein
MKNAVLVLMLAAGALAQQATKPGVERWQVKTSVPEGSATAQVVALADLLAIPDAAGVTRNDKRFQLERIPAQAGMKHAEGAVISTTGWLHLVAGESDGDYHIQLSASATSGDPCLIVEVPDPDPLFVKSADLLPEFETVRSFIRARLLAGKDPSASGSVMRHPVFVRVTGILFYDDSHVGDAPRGKKGMKAATLWELHPVTAIAFAPKVQ